MDDSSKTTPEERLIKVSLNIAVRLALAALLAVFCFRIVQPFLVPLTWATILAVALKGVFATMVRMTGGRRGLAGVIFSLTGIILVVGPSYILGGSLLGSARDLRAQLESGTLTVPAPPRVLEKIPVLGERIEEAWSLANTNLEEALVQLEPQLRAFGRWALGFLAGFGGMILTTVLSLIIAGILLTFAEPATKAVRAVTRELQGDWDEDLVGMASITISSVAKGVLGVAVIQSFLCAIGMLVAGVPAAGILSIIVLFLAVIQLPPLLIMILPIIWAWGHMGTIGALVFTVYSIAASASDTPLKAVFLSRGNVVPMPVVLLGAIGGMVSMGMMGLFLGAVVLSVGYQLVRIWMAGGDLPETSEPEPAGA